MAQIITDKRLKFGALPRNMLTRSKLKPMARLLWGVLDSCGKDTVEPTLGEICRRMGLSPRSKGSVIEYAVQLVLAGFLEVSSGLDRKVKIGAKGFKWDKNVYTLTLPDYCFVEEPELLKFALQSPIQANLSGWAPALRGGLAGARRARWRAKRAALEGGLAGQEGAQAPGRGSLASPDALGSASPDVAALASPDALGSASPDEPHRASPDAIKEFLEKPSEGGLEGPPPQTAFHRAEKTPVGWEPWQDLYLAGQGKRFVWTADARGAALAVNEYLKRSSASGQLDLVELLQLQKNFVACPYWSKRGLPLPKLLKNLNEYLPASRSQAQRCRHVSHLVVKSEAEAGELNGVAGYFKILTYKCGHVLKGEFTPNMTEAEAEQHRLFMEKHERRKKDQPQQDQARA